MSGWSDLTSFASKALSTAQKRIDKALEINDVDSNSQTSASIVTDDDLFAAFDAKSGDETGTSFTQDYRFVIKILFAVTAAAPGVPSMAAVGAMLPVSAVQKLDEWSTWLKQPAGWGSISGSDALAPDIDTATSESQLDESFGTSINGVTHMLCKLWYSHDGNITVPAAARRVHKRRSACFR